jgi:hypothetical protein
LFVEHNGKVACRRGSQCPGQTITCRFRHWDYCVQYYLFGRCGCNPGYGLHIDQVEGHVSRDMFRLAAESSPTQLLAMWQGLLDARQATEAARAADAARQRQQWVEHLRKQQNDAMERVQKSQLARHASQLAAHETACHMHEAKVAATGSLDALIQAQSKHKCPHQHSLQEDERELLIHMPVDRPLHNVKKKRGFYPVCPLCLFALVDARPEDVASLQLVPQRTLNDASPALLLGAHAILSRISTYKKSCLQALEDVGICRDVAQLALAYIGC